MNFHHGEKTIYISQNKHVIVDDDDYEKLCIYKWQYTGHGYARRTIKKTKDEQLVSYMHREILDAPKNMQVDHINGNRLDNRRCNLRLCSRAENSRNRIVKPRGTSKYKGVYFDKEPKKYRARIQTQKWSKCLGHYSNEDDAAMAYNIAALKYFREFANLNWIGGGNVN